MKKGFSLLETVIAISVVMLISVGFFGLSTFANNQFKRMQVKEHGILMIENVKAVFDNEDFVQFSTNLQWATGLTLTQQGEDFVATCKVNVDGTPNQNGVGEYVFWVQQTENIATLNAKILFSNKQIYEMPAYTKVVAQ